MKNELTLRAQRITAAAALCAMTRTWNGFPVRRVRHRACVGMYAMLAFCLLSANASVLAAENGSSGGPAPGAAVSQASKDLAKLCEDYWNGFLHANPSWATMFGYRQYNDRLADITPEGRARETERLKQVLSQAESINPRTLTEAERLTRSALVLEARNGIDRISCGLDAWLVDPVWGPQVEFLSLVTVTPFESPEDARMFVKRCRAMGLYINDHITNLQRGLKHKKVASRDAVRKTIESLDALLAQKDEEWPLLQPLKVNRDGWASSDTEAFQRDLTHAVRDVVRPAFTRYRDFLKAEIAPAARPPEKAGIVYLPGGKDDYRKLVRIQTSPDIDAETLHETGLREVARNREEISALGRRIYGTGDFAEIKRRVRNDPALRFRTSAEVVDKARTTLARAKAAMPNWFATLPKADCEVREMGVHEAPTSSGAYYVNPAQDGTRPAYYMISTYQPERQSRYIAESTAVHEAIPGHHLQTAIAQELSGLPDFRRFIGAGAYIEGWACYAERLADEMGLYSSEIDRLGMLSDQVFRACRLVVDTGLHHKGWSRQKATDYMVENVLDADPSAMANEVDRYLSDPGQALSYRAGQLEILKLRDEGRKRLGDRFDIKGFHDTVLRNGAVALPVLREQVEAYYAEAERSR